ncbi:MAG: hypothetical protein M3280_10875 [Actinomycetota bacterium]|nr:hypothetical protein [Actinomycetota bacterium]
MRRLLAFLVLPALLLPACDGGGDGDPKERLIAAFEEGAGLESGTVTISLVSTPESLVAASEGEMTTDQAETILGSSVSISGTQSEDPAEQSARIALNVAGTQGVEVLITGADLYVRADVRGLLETFGQDPAQVDAFLQSPQAQGLDFLEAAANGQFIKFEGAAEMAGQFGGTNPAQMTAQQEQFLNELKNLIREEAEVTSQGEDDVGEHLVVAVNVRQAYQRFVRLIGETAGGQIPPGTLPPAEEVPDGNLSIDFWISDGRLAQIEFDFLQVGKLVGEEPPEGVEQLGVRVAISEDAEAVEPPSDAVTVTQQELEALVGSFLFGGGDAFGGGGGFPGEETPGDGEQPPPAGVDCSIYEDLPPETFEGLPQETLDQLEQVCPGIVPGG